MFKRFLPVALSLIVLCLPGLAAPQPYVLDLRNGGAPATGLAAQLNAGAYQSATAPTGAAVTTNLPTWTESTLIPGLYACQYDAAANGPLLYGVTLTGLSDPNEGTVRVAMLADPALIAAGPANVWAYPVDGALTAKTALGATFAVTASAPLIAISGANQTTTFYHYGSTTSPFVVSVLGRNTGGLPVTKSVTLTP